MLLFHPHFDTQTHTQQHNHAQIKILHYFTQKVTHSHICCFFFPPVVMNLFSYTFIHSLSTCLSVSNGGSERYFICPCGEIVLQHKHQSHQQTYSYTQPNTYFTCCNKFVVNQYVPDQLDIFVTRKKWSSANVTDCGINKILDLFLMSRGGNIVVKRATIQLRRQGLSLVTHNICPLHHSVSVDTFTALSLTGCWLLLPLLLYSKQSICR